MGCDVKVILQCAATRSQEPAQRQLPRFAEILSLQLRIKPMETSQVSHKGQVLTHAR